ncbi:MAG TPA: alpha/beta hydrolase [Ramlibacter sp.]|nr:alpha/beta hydrolase [Ramlibacter sp.]
MAFANINGIRINYLVKGSGPHLLLFAPGGFNSVIGNWTAKEGKNAWKEMDGLEVLSRHFTVIAYDRREAGLSGGRVEPLRWDAYVEEAVGLLELLDVRQTYLLGGCMGASLVAAFAARHPERCKGLMLHWPVGGYRWMQRGHAVFNSHIEFARAQGLLAVAQRAKGKGNFWADPESGPWAAPLSHDAGFAAAYVRQDLESYMRIVEQSRETLFGDAFPSGASAAELVGIQAPALIMSGKDEVHAVSCAWTLHELMSQSELWDVFPPHQSGGNTLERILRFKARLENPSAPANHQV